MEIKYFKSKIKTKRFNENQKVFIRYGCANHLHIYFKYRGNGRWVNGICDKFHKSVGEIKTLDVSEYFANKILDKC